MALRSTRGAFYYQILPHGNYSFTILLSITNHHHQHLQLTPQNYFILDLIQKQ